MYLVIAILSTIGLICLKYIHSKLKATKNLLRLIKIGMDNRDKIIDAMTEDLSTDLHNKEWVKRYYVDLINKE